MRTRIRQAKIPSGQFTETPSWITHEISTSKFPDERLSRRFGVLLSVMARRVGDTIPAACQDWANTKAAYRFLSNEHVTEREILAGHFLATSDRASRRKGTLLVLHDTCEFSYQRGDSSTLGLIGKQPTGRPKAEGGGCRTLRGILLHSSLVVTTTGLPLGLAAVKFWTREKFKGCNALKRKINPTRVPIQAKESQRWLENVRQSTELLGRPENCVHIGDRESDIYELFCAAHEAGTKFLIRTCVNRLARDGASTVGDAMAKSRSKGTHRIHGRDANGKDYEAVLEIKYERMLVRPPIGKQKEYPALELTVIHATEPSPPQGREKVEWKLITNLPVLSHSAAIEKLEWYAMRWKIETFHKVLKSGCKAEESKLRTSERLAKLIAMLCIVGWRIFWMTMLQRETKAREPKEVFTEIELRILNQVVRSKTRVKQRKEDLQNYIRRVARLGGYLDRAGDSPPGNLVMWRGMSRLNDIHLGVLLAIRNVGN